MYFFAYLQFKIYKKIDNKLLEKLKLSLDNSDYYLKDLKYLILVMMILLMRIFQKIMNFRN